MSGFSCTACAASSTATPRPFQQPSSLPALPTRVAAECLRPYQPNLPPTLRVQSRDVPIVIGERPPDIRVGAVEPCITLPSSLMQRAATTLEEEFQSCAMGVNLESLPVSALVSTNPDDASALDAAAVYLAHTLGADFVVFNLQDIVDGESGILGKDFCDAIWSLYVAFDAFRRARRDEARSSVEKRLNGFLSGLLATTGKSRSDAAFDSLFRKASVNSDSESHAKPSADPTGGADDTPAPTPSGDGDSLEAVLTEATSKAIEYLRVFLCIGVTAHPSRRRLLYLRNYATLSPVFLPLAHALHRAVRESSLPVVVIAGISPPETGSASDGQQVDDFLKLFSDFDALKGHIAAHYAPELRRMPENGDLSSSSLQELFQTALLHHLGVVELGESSSSSRATIPGQASLIFRRVIPVGIYSLPALWPTSEVTSNSLRIASANLVRLRFALQKRGIQLRYVGRALARDWLQTLTDSARQPFSEGIQQLSQSVQSPAYILKLAAQLAECLVREVTLEELVVGIEQHDAASKELNVLLEADSRRYQPKMNYTDAVAAICKQRGYKEDSEDARALGGLIVDPATIETRFEDVCVQPHIRDQLRSVVTLPLLFNEAYSTGVLGAESMDGVLLYGPSGGGKTMLSSALARSSGVNMLQIRASDIDSHLPGVTERRIRDIFALARSIAPCIIFIDEIDGLFQKPKANAARWHLTQMTELLQAMDGLTSKSINKERRVIVVGATNRPYDLDDALLRRLPCRIFVDLPDQADRERIILQYLEGETRDDTVDIAALARCTVNFSGSDLKDLVYSAARAAFKETVPNLWEAASDRLTAPLPQRVISARHFKHAMTEVSATCRSNMEGIARLREFAHVDDSRTRRLAVLKVYMRKALRALSYASVRRLFQRIR